jgi:cytochrome c-type biogenesis protein CcmH
MIFWILAAVVLAIAAFVTCIPLFRPKTGWTPIALALVFLLPTSAIMLYPYIGTPAALDQEPVSTHTANTNENTDIEAMVAKLRARLTESPEHLDGWILLANTYKTMKRYSEALEALETAHRIAPDKPSVAVELVEARIYVSDQGRIDGEMTAVLEEAIAKDPQQQKALWLLGIASSQSGNDARAIDYWQSLLAQLEPDRTITGQVQERIAQAQKRLGIEPDVSVPGKGIKIYLSAGDELKANMPSSSVLFVIIRTAGPAAGPPLGVRRIDNPALPLELTISDQDSMMPERKISSQTEVQLQARLSLTGAPGAQSGDWQSTPVLVPLASVETAQLIMDQRVD